MGKRTWLLWSSVVLTSTLLGLLFAASHARSLAMAEQRRKMWDHRILVGGSPLDASNVAIERALIRALGRSNELSTGQTLPQIPTEVFRQIAQPGFLPPEAGQRNLLDSIDAIDLPRALRDSLERLESAKRIEVSWNEQTARATLQQTDDSFRLTTISLKDPKAPANVVTVVDKVAYIEDHGEDFSLPRARFQLPVDRDFVLSVNNVWWKALGTSYRNRRFQVSAIPGGAAIVETKAITNHEPIRYTVADGSYLTSFATTSLPYQISKVTYEFATSFRWKSIDPPSWAPASTRVPMTWDEILPQEKPDWIEPVVRVKQVKQSSDNVLGSQCGSTPFTPETLPAGMQLLPTGAAFRCQINLADVPQIIGLPASGLLEFFTVNEFESGFVRYFPEIDASAHNDTRALNISIDKTFEPTSLSFTAAETTKSFEDVREKAPRSLRFLRGPNGYPLINSVESDPDLVTALTRRGVNYVANAANTMGGHWDANGATPPGYTRLFMITDDVGYAYWHIPSADLAAARFDRVVGGWTD
jgi:Domain of unknown function (DUF1963)